MVTDDYIFPLVTETYQLLLINKMTDSWDWAKVTCLRETRLIARLALRIDIDPGNLSKEAV